MRRFMRWMRWAGCLSVLFLAAPANAAAPGPGLIAEIQTQLQQHGYDPGPADGVLTAKTRRAILAYQRDTGLPPDGVASPRLAEDLRATLRPGPSTENPIAAVQAALQQLGFRPGPIDGVLGPRTRDAIIRFQVANRLPVDPRISDRLLAELRQAAPGASGPQAAGPAGPPAPQAMTPEALGRQPLPAGVKPPPIR